MDRTFNNKIPLVSVWMITYNHERYISHALDSVLGQKTNFNFEIVIGEDCSLDNTRKILNEYQNKYPSIIKALYHEKNVGAIRNANEFTIPMCIGQYISALEADDYWTYEHKLQKQVDFLEANPEYAMVCTDYDVLYQSDNRIEKDYLKTNFGYTEPKDVELEYYINKRKYIRTLTACFRREQYDKYVSEIDEKIRNNNAAGDLPIWLYFLATSKVKYLPDSTAVYRVSPNTASRIQDRQKRFEFSQAISGILEYYAAKYKLSKRVTKQIKANRILTRMVYDFFKNKTFEIFRGLMDLALIGVKSKQAIYLFLGSMNSKMRSIAVKKYDLENFFN